MRLYNRKAIKNVECAPKVSKWSGKARTLGAARGVEASIAMTFDGRAAAAAAAGEEEETLAEMMVIVFFLFGLPLGNWLNCFRSREREREREKGSQKERGAGLGREKKVFEVCAIARCG